MRVAAVQMTSTPDVSANLAEARHWIERAVDERAADLVALPEFFCLLTDNVRQLLREAGPSSGRSGMIVETLREWAAEYGIWLLGGSIPLKTAGSSKRLTNTSLLLSPEGEIVARYDKIHLFDAQVGPEGEKGKRYEESRGFKPGSRVVVAKTPWAPVGLSVCYDVRFPELYRKMAARGAQVLFIPSAFTSITGRAHWDVLTRARAIENQCYVVCPAQTGSPYEGRQTHGHTRIIDPWGRVIAERPGGAGITWADLDFEKLERVRAEMPVLKHRRLSP